MLLGASIVQDTGPVIKGDGVVLRPASMSDYAAWAALRERSRALLTRWEPQWSLDELTRTSFRRRIRHYARESREDLGYAFLIFVPGGQLSGGLTLSNVRRGVTQSATIGYWLGTEYTGRGIMTAAIRATIPFAFEVLKLHRLDAAVMPANTASVAVLERTGFVREGLARRYLKIAGRWEDHHLYALLVDDVPPSRAGAVATGSAGEAR